MEFTIAVMLNTGFCDYLIIYVSVSVRLPYGPADPQRSQLDGLPISVTDLLQKSGVRFVPF